MLPDRAMPPCWLTWRWLLPILAADALLVAAVCAVLRAP